MAPDALTPPARISFVGLGAMGAPMTTNLVAAGYRVTGCDVDSTRAAALGIESAATPAEAAASAEVVITSLPSLDDLRAVVLGEDGVSSGARPGMIFVDVSTTAPSLSRELARALERFDVAALDAPVSGGPSGARDGSLTIMVGGPQAAYQRCESLLGVLGRRVVWFGDAPGSGQIVKLCNNLISGSTMLALSDACAIAERQGVDPRLLYEVLTNSLGDSRVLRTRYPLEGADAAHPANHDFAPLLTLDLLVKDLALAIEVAQDADVSLIVGPTVLERYRQAQAAGLGSQDYSVVHLAPRGAA